VGCVIQVVLVRVPVRAAGQVRVPVDEGDARKVGARDNRRWVRCVANDLGVVVCLWGIVGSWCEWMGAVWLTMIGEETRYELRATGQTMAHILTRIMATDPRGKYTIAGETLRGAFNTAP
jgi:hypothetical protein